MPRVQIPSRPCSRVASLARTRARLAPHSLTAFARVDPVASSVTYPVSPFSLRVRSIRAVERRRRTSATRRVRRSGRCGVRGGRARHSGSAAPREWQHYSDPLFAAVFASIDPLDRWVRGDLDRNISADPDSTSCSSTRNRHRGVG